MLPDEQDCQSTTHQLCFQGSPEKPEDLGTLYEDQNSIILLVKECQEAESGNSMRKSASYDHNQQPLDKVQQPCNHQFSNPQRKQERSCLLGEGAEKNNDGFQTPTKFMAYESTSSGLKCPPAPRKRKAEPLAKRRRVCRRNLQVEFVADVELVLRLLANGDPKLKKPYTLAANESSYLGTYAS